jgi:DNA-directed RNA polymerase subunit N (RpoN/RPB10)
MRPLPSSHARRTRGPESLRRLSCHCSGPYFTWLRHVKRERRPSHIVDDLCIARDICTRKVLGPNGDVNVASNLTNTFGAGDCNVDVFRCGQPVGVNDWLDRGVGGRHRQRCLSRKAIQRRLTQWHSCSHRLGQRYGSCGSVRNSRDVCNTSCTSLKPSWWGTP